MNMPKKSQKGGVPDFIINSLKEHEKILDRLISELGEITTRLGKTGKLDGKLDGINQQILYIQTQISSARAHFAESSFQPVLFPLVVTCKQWEDFKALASDAETIALHLSNKEKIFQTNALKGGRFLTYSGKFPLDVRLLKLLLSRELNVDEAKIFEGSLVSTFSKTSDKILCSLCGVENNPEALFCQNCGNKLDQQELAGDDYLGVEASPIEKIEQLEKERLLKESNQLRIYSAKKSILKKEIEYLKKEIAEARRVLNKKE
jgi:hypothetical protein